jgi:hypothetical protein
MNSITYKCSIVQIDSISVHFSYSTLKTVHFSTPTGKTFRTVFVHFRTVWSLPGVNRTGPVIGRDTGETMEDRPPEYGLSGSLRPLCHA